MRNLLAPWAVIERPHEADILRQILNEEVELKTDDGNITKMTYRKAIAKRFILNAIKGKEVSMKTVLQYDAGMPNQPISIDKNVDPDDYIDPDHLEEAMKQIDEFFIREKDDLGNKKNIKKKGKKK